jgi:hypothetical protein
MRCDSPPTPELPKESFSGFARASDISEGQSRQRASLRTTRPER